MWKVKLNEGTRYKFTVFEHSLYTLRVNTKKAINSIISIYYEIGNNKIGDENFISSTSKTEKIPNCFIFNCKISGDYLVVIQSITQENIDRRYRSKGILYYLNRID